MTRSAYRRPLGRLICLAKATGNMTRSNCWGETDMPYLSRVLLNPARAEARKFFANPQLVKGAIFGEFARQPVNERVLWRLEQRRMPGSDRYQGELLVLTASRLGWAGLVERVGYPECDGGAATVREYSPLLATVGVGRQFAFRVRVNPVQNTRQLESPTKSEAVRQANPARRRSLRVAHRTVAAQTKWFLERVEKWGFRVLDGTVGEPNMRIVGRDHLDFTKGGTSAQHRVRLGTATFEGVLEVVDTERFTAALLGGVGPAKGYGCGLITLARPLRDTAGPHRDAV